MRTRAFEPRWRRSGQGTGDEARPYPASVRTLEIESAISRGAVSFLDVCELRRTAAGSPEFQSLYIKARDCFEKHEGVLTKLYTFDAASVGMSIKRRRAPARWLGAADLAHAQLLVSYNRYDPAVAEIVAECETLQLRCEDVLRPTERRAILDEATAALSQVLAHDMTTGGAGPLLLETVRVDLARVRERFDAAAQRSSQFTYLLGMLLGVIPATAMAALVAALVDRANIAGFQPATFVAVLFAGALGAVVSVLSRMGSGSFGLATYASRVYVRSLGVIRPFVGTVFAGIIYFALVGGLLTLQVGTASTRFYFYVVVGFFAGFNERWARDMLAFSERRIGGRPASVGGSSSPSAGTNEQQELPTGPE